MMEEVAVLKGIVLVKQQGQRLQQYLQLEAVVAVATLVTLLANLVVQAVVQVSQGVAIMEVPVI
jgi:hypothetical protein